MLKASDTALRVGWGRGTLGHQAFAHQQGPHLGITLRPNSRTLILAKTLFLMQRFNCKLSHIHREGKACADFLANKGVLLLPRIWGSWKFPPQGLSSLHQVDISSVTYCKAQCPTAFVYLFFYSFPLHTHKKKEKENDELKLTNTPSCS